MAITPSEALDFTTHELAVVDRVVTAINNELIALYELGKPVTIRHELLRIALDENIKVYNSVKSSFVSAGWEVIEYSGNQGLWLSLSAA